MKMTTKLALATAVSWATVFGVMEAQADPSTWYIGQWDAPPDVADYFRLGKHYYYSHKENTKKYPTAMEACKDLQFERSLPAWANMCDVRITTWDDMTDINGQTWAFYPGTAIRCDSEPCIQANWPDKKYLQCFGKKVDNTSKWVPCDWRTEHLGSLTKIEQVIPQQCSQVEYRWEPTVTIEVEFPVKEGSVDNQAWIGFDVGEVTYQSGIVTEGAYNAPIVRSGPDDLIDNIHPMLCHYSDSEKTKVQCSVDFNYGDVLRSRSMNENEAVQIATFPEMYRYSIITGDGKTVKQDCIRWTTGQWNSSVEVWTNGRRGMYGVGMFQSKNQAIDAACRYGISRVEQPASLWDIKTSEDYEWLPDNEFICEGSNSPNPNVQNITLRGSVSLVEDYL